MRRWYGIERELKLMEELSTERTEAEQTLKKLLSKNQDLENEVRSLRNFVGSMSMDLERDLPSFREQTPWETGIYEVPDTEESWYFNPTIMRVGNRKILVGRHIWMNRDAWQNRIVFFGLNGDKVEGEQVLQLPMNQHNESFEDPRAFTDGKRWYLSMVDFIQRQTYGHQIIVPLDELLRPIKIYHPRIGKNGESIYANSGTEKNHLTFFHDGEPHIIYWTNPHTVFRYDWFGGCLEKFEQPIIGGTWLHGEPRGGTPPIRVGDHYVSFFHSFTPWKFPRRRYHMGCYFFESKPPFKVTHMTSLPILSASSRDGERPPLPIVIFPGGALLDNGMWHVVFGLNDLKMAWIKIPHVDLMNIVKPLEQVSRTVFMPDQKSVEREPVTVDGKAFA